MTLIYNRKELKDGRRSLRNNSTLAERILWTEIRKRQLYGIRFLRQYSIDSYVLDFYSPEIKLAIEVDGETHFDCEDSIVYDRDRQLYIESFGITFIRFKNEEVVTQLHSVLLRLKEKIEILLKQS